MNRVGNACSGSSRRAKVSAAARRSTPGPTIASRSSRLRWRRTGETEASRSLGTRAGTHSLWRLSRRILSSAKRISREDVADRLRNGFVPLHRQAGDPSQRDALPHQLHAGRFDDIHVQRAALVADRVDVVGNLIALPGAVIAVLVIPRL